MRNKKKIIYGIIGLLICFIFVFLYLKVFINSPFPMDGDIFVHLGNAEHLKQKGYITNNLYYYPGKQDWYSYFPLFNILMVIISFLTGMEISLVFLFMGLLLIPFILLSFYILIKNINSKNIPILLFSLLLLLPVGNSGNFRLGYTTFHFLYLTPSSLSLFLILILLGFIITLLKDKKNNNLILIFLLFLSAILYHIELAFRISVILGIIFLISFFLFKEHRNNIKKLLIIFVSIAIMISLTNYRLFLDNFNLYGKISMFFGQTQITTEVSKAINLLNFYGEIIIIFILLGIFWVIKNLKQITLKKKYPQIFWGMFLICSIILGYQHLFKLHFFPQRFLELSIYPIIFFSSTIIYYLIIKLSNKKKIILTFLIILVIITSFGSKISQTNLGSSWDYIKDLTYLRDNLDEGIVISDFWTLLKITGACPNLSPSYSFDRPGKFKDYINLQEKVPDIQHVFYSNKDESYKYLKSNNISYVIIDNLATPFRIPVDYKKFDDKMLFDKVYKSKLTTVYRVKNE